MIRQFALRLALLPLAVVAAHFLGFAYAMYARPLQSARTLMFNSAEAQQPIHEAYVAYIAGALGGDLGAMPRTGVPLGPAVAAAFANSLGLLIPALVISALLGFLIGRSGVRPERPGVAPWLTIGASVGLAMPGVFVGSLAIAALIAYLIWGPGDPPLPLRGFGWDAHLVLPLAVLCVRPVAQMAQMTAGLLAAEVGKQHIIAARSRGIDEDALVNRHALWPVIAPLLQTIAGSLRALTAELIIVEKLFDWPGIGALLAATLIPSRISTAAETPLFLHVPLLAATLACIAGLLVLADGLAVVTARIADPRLRSEL
jgi:peptide/nickel transport system permease protein